MDKINALLCGVGGAMGQTVIAAAAERDDIVIAAGFDRPGTAAAFPVYGDLNEIKEKIDVVIDFSHKSVTDTVTDWCVKNKVPLVSAVTGIDARSEEKIAKAAEAIAVIRSTNFSLGVYVMNKLVAEAVKLLGDSCDIEIVEAHHRLKADAPSGTAKTLLASINAASGGEHKTVYGRSGECRREAGEIGIHSLRGGSIAGEHSVIFAGDDEVITVTHSAGSKKIFARGALTAAVFAAKKPCGLYHMEDLFSAE